MAARKKVNAPTETKIVYASGGAAVVGLLLWLLGTYVFGGDVPAPLAGFLEFFIPGVVAYIAGYVKTTPLHVLKGRASAAVAESVADGHADMS